MQPKEPGDKRSQSVPPLRNHSALNKDSKLHQPFPYDTTPILSLQDGLAVRPWRPGDVAQLAHIVTPNLSKGYISDIFEGKEGVLGAFTWFLDTRSQDQYRTTSDGAHVPQDFAITLHDVAIGNIGIEILSSEDSACFPTGELGYFLAEEHWGKGIMTEVVKSFLPWVFRSFKQLNRVDAFVFSTWVPASSKVLQKAGLKLEGSLRSIAWKQGLGHSDDDIWAILRSECVENDCWEPPKDV